jgi:hypothetical protein
MEMDLVVLGDGVWIWWCMDDMIWCSEMDLVVHEQEYCTWCSSLWL